MPLYQVHIPEIHRVTVTVEAGSADEARLKAEELTSIEGLRWAASAEPVYKGRLDVDEWEVSNDE